MSDLLLLACTLHHANWALVLHRGHLYGMRGRALWRVGAVAEAATALPAERWGQA